MGSARHALPSLTSVLAQEEGTQRRAHGGVTHRPAQGGHNFREPGQRHGVRSLHNLLLNPEKRRADDVSISHLMTICEEIPRKRTKMENHHVSSDLHIALFINPESLILLRNSNKRLCNFGIQTRKTRVLPNCHRGMRRDYGKTVFSKTSAGGFSCQVAQRKSNPLGSWK